MRVAVVTGASSGNRRRAVPRAARARLARRRASRARRRPTPTSTRPATSPTARRSRRSRARVLERHPRIDLLVNNAGVAGRQSFLDADAGADRGARCGRTTSARSGACARSCRGSARARTSSTSSRSPALVAVGPYSASKHAQLAFSRSVAVELAPRGISVHTVNPGFVETPGFPQRERFRGRQLPARRAPGARRRADPRRRSSTTGARSSCRAGTGPAAWVQALAPRLVARPRPGRTWSARRG